MTVIIDKNNSKNVSKILKEKLQKSNSKGNLVKHFGKLKRDIDGLKYQIAIREEEERFYCGYQFSHLYSRRKQNNRAIS